MTWSSTDKSLPVPHTRAVPDGITRRALGSIENAVRQLQQRLVTVRADQEMRERLDSELAGESGVDRIARIEARQNELEARIAQLENP